MNGLFGGAVSVLAGMLGSCVRFWFGSTNNDIDTAEEQARLITDLGEFFVTSDGDNLIFSE